MHDIVLLKGTPLILDGLHLKAHKKLDGSKGLVEFFLQPC